jgi:hypothetical protein
VGSNTTIYSDLGAGTSYGDFVVPGIGASDSVFEFPLNSAALNDINSFGSGYFSVGGALLSNSGDDYFVGVARPAALHLVLVPEPKSSRLLPTLFCLVALIPRSFSIPTRKIHCTKVPKSPSCGMHRPY